MKVSIMVYLVIVNFIAFLVYGVDKRKAEKHQWRISERILFLVAILGGGLGAFIGMQLFHHKTKHWYFVVFIPLIAILWGIGLFLIWKNVLV